MSKASPPSLRDRVESRIREDRAQMDRMIEAELRSFEESFRSSARAALNTIESDTAARIRPLARSLRRAWLIPMVVGLSLSFGLLGGSWGLMRFLSSNLQDLAQSIDEQRRTLSELRSETTGITLHRFRGETYLTLPEGWSLEQKWKTAKGMPAWKLSKN